MHFKEIIFNLVFQELHQHCQFSLLISFTAPFPINLLPLLSYFSSIVFLTQSLPSALRNVSSPAHISMPRICKSLRLMAARLPMHRCELENQFGLQPTDFCSCSMLCHQWQGFGHKHLGHQMTHFRVQILFAKWQFTPRGGKKKDLSEKLQTATYISLLHIAATDTGSKQPFCPQG